MPFWQTNNNASATSSSSSSSSSSSASTSSSSMSSNNSMINGNNISQQTQISQSTNHHHHQVGGERSNLYSTTTTTVSLVAKSLLPSRRRLKLDPSNKLFFPYEPGKQVRSAIGIKNISKSHVAFKFQTTAPKSCYMRPPGGILAPGEGLIATVFKFVEPPENNEKPLDQKSRVKFKIMSLKVKTEMEYIPEMFDEQKDQVAVEQILRVIFLDPESPNPALEKLKRQLAEAEAELESRKKPPEETGPRVVGEGLVIDEWKERRERYLARQQVEVDSV
ncbi:PapD-like superfamily protein [Euphorbia peplus]|nr:PapD-like superfamily protein [Euphorbia peplus]